MFYRIVECGYVKISHIGPSYFINAYHPHFQSSGKISIDPSQDADTKAGWNYIAIERDHFKPSFL
jgi:hypothetical protein